MSVVSNLIIRAGADFTGMKREMNKAQGTLANFQKGIQGTVSKIGTALAAIGTGMVLGGAVSDAAKYEAAMGTLSQTMGESMGTFEKWQTTVGASMGFSKLQSAQLANTLSLNFKAIAKDQQDLVNKTTEMMRTAAVIANKRGMDMAEVSDRIRSAMNQEADGADELGVNVRASAIVQGEAYKQMADGKPWADLSSNQQKAILYQHILNSVSANLGDTLQNNTAMKMSVFTASLLDVRLALGQAFLPILNVVLPVLTTFMRYIEKALQYVAAFSSALFGTKKFGKAAEKSSNDQAKAADKHASAVGGVGDAVKDTAKKTKKAAKEMKQNLAGFDKLNILSFKKDSASDSSSGAGKTAGGVGAGGPAGITPDMSGGDGAGFKIPKKIQEMADAFRKKIQPIIDLIKKAWAAVKTYFIDKFKQLKEFWVQNSAQLGEAWKNFMKIVKPVFLWLVKTIWNDIKGAIDGIIKVVLGLVKIFMGVFTGDWKAVWDGCKDVLLGAIKAIWHIFNLVFFGKILKGFGLLGKGMIKLAKKPWNAIKGLFEKGIKSVKEGIKTQIDNIKGTFNAFKDMGANSVEAAIGAVEIVWQAMKGALGTMITNVATEAGKIWGAIKGVFTNTAVSAHFNKVFGYISSALTSAKTAVGNAAKAIWDWTKGKFTGAYDFFRYDLAGSVSKAWTNAKSSIGTAAAGVWNTIKSKFSGAYSWFKTSVIDKIAKAFGNIKNSFSKGVVDGVKSLINKLIDGINAPLKNLKSFSVMGKKPFAKLPTIPKLAKGGITTGSTLANIGEAGTEAVLPLQNNTGWMDDLAKKLVNRMGNGSPSSGGGGDVIIKIGESELGRIAINSINKMQRQSGRSLLRI